MSPPTSAQCALRNRPLVRLNPQRIPAPDVDQDENEFGSPQDPRRDDDPIEEEPRVIEMDQGAEPPSEHDVPYPANYDELAAAPEHLDWSARAAHMLNQRQYLTWDECGVCGMYVVNRWCNHCSIP
eukprot:1530816-Amphidinium_carterae.1